MELDTLPPRIMSKIVAAHDEDIRPSLVRVVLTSGFGYLKDV